jgi:hypothetical protein
MKQKLLFLTVKVSLCFWITGSYPQAAVTFSSYDNFKDGNFQNVCLESYGALSSGPKVELLETFLDTPIVWSAAQDSKGNLYLAVGNGYQKAGVLLKRPAQGPLSATLQTPEPIISAIQIDANGSLLLSTSPNGKVYKHTTAEGLHAILEPSYQYIWDLALEPNGTLWVAAGGPRAALYRININHPDLRMDPIFVSDAIQFTSLKADGKGGVYAGTGVNGLIYHLTPNEKGLIPAVAAYVPGEEITEMELDSNGNLIFSTFNDTPKSESEPSKMERLIVFVDQTNEEDSLERIKKDFVNVSPEAKSEGGSLYRVTSDGFLETLWTLDSANLNTFLRQNSRWLCADAEHGKIWSTLGQNGDWAMEAELKLGGQVTVLLPYNDQNEGFYAITSNPSALYRVSKAPSTQSIFTSHTQDAGKIVQYGRMELTCSEVNTIGKGLRVTTRSGNLPDPDETWSPWTHLNEQGSITSPAGRYLQYRIEWIDSNITVRQVRYFYKEMRHNPVIDALKVVDVHVVYSPNSRDLIPHVKIKDLLQNDSHTLWSMLQQKPTANFALTADLGWITAVWSVQNDQNIPFEYSVWMRPIEGSWQLISNHLKHSLLSISSTGFIDGWYEIRVEASDAPANPTAPLKSSRVSEPFLIDNTGPTIVLKKLSNISSGLSAEFIATDAQSIISSASYKLLGGPNSLESAVYPEDGIFDSLSKNLALTIAPLSPGSYVLQLQVEDECGNVAHWNQEVQVK